MTTSNTQPSSVPADLDLADWSAIQPHFDALAKRPLDSPADLSQWLRDLSDLLAAIDEFGSRRYIDHACHTDDPAIEKAYLDFVENIEPKLKPAIFAQQKKFLACPHRTALNDPKFDLLARYWQADVDLYRDENVPLETQVTKHVTEYDKACGQMIVEFRGQSYTLQQLARFIEEPDRATRQQAWELAETRRAQDREAFDTLFDQLLELRRQIAVNANLADYRQYLWLHHKRFDYTPDDCLRFADAVRKTCLPVVDQLNRRRREDLGVDALRPWDLAVDPKGRPPLRPFPANDADQLVTGVRTLLGRIAPTLADEFHSLKQHQSLDLESRKGKRPGGFQATLAAQRRPFIFMNAAGLHRDVVTLLHEFGHALHCLQARQEPLIFFAHAPMEFAEVASMSMELLAEDHLSVFYDPQEAQRAKRVHLEGIIRLLPWIATIDSFQHWLYTHPHHTPDQRADAWLEISASLASDQIDWTGHQDVRRFYWQRQLHLYHVPFYYIEYGIAQLGALGVWLNHRRDSAKALADYRHALALGGTRSLPDLFTAAGLRFGFSADTLAPLMDAVSQELSALPS